MNGSAGVGGPGGGVIGSSKKNSPAFCGCSFGPVFGNTCCKQVYHTLPKQERPCSHDRRWPRSTPSRSERKTHKVKINPLQGYLPEVCTQLARDASSAYAAKIVRHGEDLRVEAQALREDARGALALVRFVGAYAHDARGARVARARVARARALARGPVGGPPSHRARARLPD